MAKVDVSLIVINYNGFKITKVMVDSLLKARVKNEVRNLIYEVVVVDNASEDESYEKLKKEYVGKKLVKIVKKPSNNFLAEAFNFGYKHSKGKLLVFMCNDLVVHKDWLVELVKGFEDKKVGIVGVSLLDYHKKKRVDCLGCSLDVFLYGTRLESGKIFRKRKGVGVVDFVSGSVVGVRRELYLKAGKFDDKYGGNYEDVDLALRVRKLGYKTVVAYGSVVYHRGSWTVDRHVGNVNSSYLCRRNRLATMIKNYPLVKLCLVLPVYLGLQVGLFFKELLVDQRLKLAMTGMRGFWWNVVNFPYLLSWRKKNFNKGLAFVKNWLEWVDKKSKEYEYRQRLDELVKVVGKSDFRMLDLGSGDGRLVKMAKKRGIKAVGIDQKQGQKIESYKVRNLVRVVSMYHVLEHTSKPLEVLKRVKNWLEKDGILVIEVPLVGNFSEKWLGEDYLAYWDKTHKQFFTKKELMELVEKAGFRLVGRGRVWHEVFFHLVTASLGQGWLKVGVSLILWLPFKLLQVLGLNDEMLRLYQKKF